MRKEDGVIEIGILNYRLFPDVRKSSRSEVAVECYTIEDVF